MLALLLDELGVRRTSTSLLGYPRVDYFALKYQYIKLLPGEAESLAAAVYVLHPTLDALDKARLARGRPRV